VYQVGINKGIILRCTAYQISRYLLVLSTFSTTGCGTWSPHLSLCKNRKCTTAFTDFPAWGTPAKAAKNDRYDLPFHLLTGWHTAESVAGELPAWTRLRLLSETSKPALGPSHPPNQWEQRGSSHDGVKRRREESNLLRLPTSDDNKAQSHTSTPTITP